MTDRSPGNGRKVSPRAAATRQAVVEVAASLFATAGYAQTSMRDIARVGPVSLAAIYSHFKNKAELLVEAIEARMASDLEGALGRGAPPLDYVEVLTTAGRTYPARSRMRALLVQGAAAAQTDDDTRLRARDAQLAHLRSWIDGYEASRARSGIDPDLDMEAAVLCTWAIELGLGVLESYGVEPPSTDAWADVMRRVALSFRPAGTGT